MENDRVMGNKCQSLLRLSVWYYPPWRPGVQSKEAAEAGTKGSTLTPHTCTESSKKVTVVGLWPWSPSAALRAGQVQPPKGINSASEMVQTCTSLFQESRLVAELWASKGDTREVEAGGAGSKAAPSAKGDSWGHLPPLWSWGRNRGKDAHSYNTPAPGSWVPYGLKTLPATLHTCCPGCHKK